MNQNYDSPVVSVSGRDWHVGAWENRDLLMRADPKAQG